MNQDCYYTLDGIHNDVHNIGKHDITVRGRIHMRRRENYSSPELPSNTSLVIHRIVALRVEALQQGSVRSVSAMEMTVMRVPEYLFKFERILFPPSISPGSAYPFPHSKL